MASLGGPLAQHGVTLKDFFINCLPENSSNSDLHGMTIVIHGLAEDDAAYLEKISATRWRYHREITLCSGMDNITLCVQAENAGDIGFVAFLEDELEAFTAVDHDIELEREIIVLEENGPTLTLTFTLGASQNVTPGFGMSPDMFDTLKNPEIFSAMLATMAEDPRLLNHFGDLYQKRFLETNCKDDIDKAVSAYILAVELTPSDDDNYGLYAGNGGLALARRFQFSGELPDIDLGISLTEIAIAYTTEDNANYCGQLNSLGVSFRKRFERTNDLADIESAISTQQRAIKLTPKGHANMPTLLNNIGNSLLTRFKHTGDLADIESAITTQQRAVKLTPEGQEDMPVHLNNLGNSFLTRFKCTDNLADIESAISTQERAVKLTPEGHAHMTSWLNNLGNSYYTRFKRTGNLAAPEAGMLMDKTIVSTYIA